MSKAHQTFDEAALSFLSCVTLVIGEIDRMPLDDRTTAGFLDRLEHVLNVELGQIQDQAHSAKLREFLQVLLLSLRG